MQLTIDVHWPPTLIEEASVLSPPNAPPSPPLSPQPHAYMVQLQLDLPPTPNTSNSILSEEEWSLDSFLRHVFQQVQLCLEMEPSTNSVMHIPIPPSNTLQSLLEDQEDLVPERALFGELIKIREKGTCFLHAKQNPLQVVSPHFSSVQVLLESLGTHWELSWLTLEEEDGDDDEAEMGLINVEDVKMLQRRANEEWLRRQMRSLVETGQKNQEPWSWDELIASTLGLSLHSHADSESERMTSVLVQNDIDIHHVLADYATPELEQWCRDYCVLLVYSDAQKGDMHSSLWGLMDDRAAPMLPWIRSFNDKEGQRMQDVQLKVYGRLSDVRAFLRLVFPQEKIEEQDSSLPILPPLFPQA